MLRKIVIEGWACRSEVESDDCGHTYYLSDQSPVTHVDKDGAFTCVPRESTESLDLIDGAELFMMMEQGQLYKVTIELIRGQCVKQETSQP